MSYNIPRLYNFEDLTADPKQGSIVVIRTVARDMVGRLVSIVEDSVSPYITIDRPLQLVGRMMPDGGLSIMCLPYSVPGAISGHSFNFAWTDVVHCYPAEGGIEAEWLKFTTGIEVTRSLPQGDSSLILDR